MNAKKGGDFLIQQSATGAENEGFFSALPKAWVQSSWVCLLPNFDYEKKKGKNSEACHNFTHYILKGKSTTDILYFLSYLKNKFGTLDFVAI